MVAKSMLDRFWFIIHDVEDAGVRIKHFSFLDYAQVRAYFCAMSIALTPASACMLGSRLCCQGSIASISLLVSPGETPAFV